MQSGMENAYSYVNNCDNRQKVLGGGTTTCTQTK